MPLVLVTKSEFARHLGVSKARVSQYVAMGLPVRQDGSIDLQSGLNWVRKKVNVWNNKWHDRGRLQVDGLNRDLAETLGYLD